MPDTYRIVQVRDFFKVPEEKRAHCLRDFELWMHAMDAFADVIGNAVVDPRGIARDLNVRLVPNRDVFNWIDDDKHDAFIRPHVDSGDGTHGS